MRLRVGLRTSAAILAVILAANVSALAQSTVPQTPGPSSGLSRPVPSIPPKPRIECVAQELDPAPGIPGFWYYCFAGGGIDGAGNTLFCAFLDGPEVHEGNGIALFYGPVGGIQKLIWESEPAPDMPDGVVIASLLGAVETISETGLISFAAIVSGPGITPGFDDCVLYAGTPGNFTKILQSGQQAPGCEPGVYIVGGIGGDLSDNGTLEVTALVDGPGIYEQARVHWIGTPENLQLAFREGMPAPGHPGVVLWREIRPVVHNDAGEISFAANLVGPGITTANDFVHLLGAPGQLIEVAREGDPAPLMPPGVTWKTVACADVTINGWGDTAVLAYIRGPGITTANNHVLYAGPPGGLHLLAQSGSLAPEAGPGVYVSSMGNCYVNNRREAFYRLTYAGPDITTVNQYGIYFGPYDAPALALRQGDPAPTFRGGITVSNLFNMPSFVAMNDVGDIIAPAQIAGPGVTDANKVVLWLRHHVLRRWIPLLRGGQNIDGRIVFAQDDGDFGLTYSNPTGGADGVSQDLNDRGMLFMGLTFTDGGQGIYRISPPLFGDADGDGDVDANDLGFAQRCWIGADNEVSSECAVFDLDLDGDVDLADQAMLQQLQTE